MMNDKSKRPDVKVPEREEIQNPEKEKPEIKQPEEQKPVIKL